MSDGEGLSYSPTGMGVTPVSPTSASLTGPYTLNNSDQSVQTDFVECFLQPPVYCIKNRRLCRRSHGVSLMHTTQQGPRGEDASRGAARGQARLVPLFTSICDLLGRPMPVQCHVACVARPGQQSDYKKQATRILGCEASAPDQNTIQHT
jgi:hypothetical protein